MAEYPAPPAIKVAAAQVLCDHPEEWALLGDHPEFAPKAIEEIVAGNVDVQENRPGLVVLTCTFSVELPGIEPGSYGIPSRLLRAQFAMPLLGSPVHAN